MAGGTPADVVEVLHGTTVGSNTILERKGAADRPVDHGRLPRRARDRPAAHARALRSRLGQAGAPDPAPPPPRGPGADRRRGPGDPGTRAGERDRGRRAPARGRHREPRDLLHQQLPQSRPRAAGGGPAARAFPELDVSASFEILPQIKEYERTSTVAVNAYLRPVLRRYLERLADGLAGLGIRAPLLVVTSNGGMAGVRTAAARAGVLRRLRAGRRRHRRRRARPQPG